MVSGLLTRGDSICASSCVFLVLGPGRRNGLIGGLGLEDAPVVTWGGNSPTGGVDVFESSLVLSLSSLSELLDIDTLGGRKS
jgi:hypothetical protein